MNEEVLKPEDECEGSQRWRNVDVREQ